MFEYKINSKWILDHFGTNKIKFNSDFFGDAMPWLVERFGIDEELDFELSIKRPRVTFGA